MDQLYNDEIRQEFVQSDDEEGGEGNALDESENKSSEWSTKGSVDDEDEKSLGSVDNYISEPTWDEDVKKEFLDSDFDTDTTASTVTSLERIRMTPMSQMSSLSNLSSCGKLNENQNEMKRSLNYDKKRSDEDSVIVASQDKAATLQSSSRPPLPNPFLKHTKNDNSDNNKGKYEDALFREANKTRLKSMGSHHSALFHGYVYNPRTEDAESTGIVTSQTKNKVKEAVQTPKKYEDHNNNDQQALSPPDFENGYVYYENGVPKLLQEEFPKAQVAKRRHQHIDAMGKNILRPHSINSIQPPVLDGYVLYEDGMPVMVFADPFVSDSDDEGALEEK